MMNSTLHDPAVVIPPRGGTAVRRTVTGLVVPAATIIVVLADNQAPKAERLAQAGAAIALDVRSPDFETALVAAADQFDASDQDEVVCAGIGWRLLRSGAPLAPPMARPVSARAAPRGVHTAAILAELG